MSITVHSSDTAPGRPLPAPAYTLPGFFLDTHVFNVTATAITPSGAEYMSRENLIVFAADAAEAEEMAAEVICRLHGPHLTVTVTAEQMTSSRVRDVIMHKQHRQIHI